MAENSSSKFYREISVPSNAGTKWKDINVNTGASVSTLQDIKVPDSSGGYAFTDSGICTSCVSNRFIYWRTTSNILELVEESLDYNLIGSHVRFRFQDTQIIGGISIHESHGNVVVLVVTVTSVHRLVFPHPSKLQRNNLGYSQTQQPVPSIFYNDAVSLVMATDPKNMHLLNLGGNLTSHIQGAVSAQNGEGQALFALSSNIGSILLIKMPPLNIQGIVQQFELSQSSMMQKLWSGLVPSFIREGQESLESATGLLIHTFKGDTFIFAICRDHKLRIWSTRTHECVAVYNVLETCPELRNAPSVSGTGHRLVKVMNSDNVNLMLCLHLNFGNRNHFCFLQPQIVSGRVQPFHIASVYGVNEDLIDFCVTADKLWTLWTNSSGESVARVCHMSGELKGSNWLEVILHPSEGGEILVPPHMDPREVYTERMFQPRRFSLYDIQKALNVYRRSLDANVPADLNINTLKQEVTLAVEDAIRSAAIANEISEEEYCQLQLEQWSKFYSCCVQYQEVGAKMKGLFADPNTGMVCIIKKGGLSYVRPCDRVEELYLGSGQWSCEDTDDMLRRDITTLGMCLSLITTKISQDVAYQFEYQLKMNEPVEDATRQIVEDLFFNTSLVDISMDSLSALVQTIRDLPNCLHVVLTAFDLSSRGMMDLDDDETGNIQELSCSQMLTGGTGIDILATTLQQTSITAFQALRDLLVFQTAVCNLGERDGVSSELSERLHSDFIPHTTMLLLSYATLKWASLKLATTSHSNSVDTNLRQLASLEISDSSGLSTSQRTGTSNMTIADLFIRGMGGTRARICLSQSGSRLEDQAELWMWGVLGITRSLQQLLWPQNDNFMFPEFLASCCQYLALQEYVFQLTEWCDVNAASRRFMLGLCYLHFDESQKAAQCYTEAKEGLRGEAFLQKLLQSDEDDVRKMEVLYYLKVIRQFEEFDCADMVVQLARTAISIADDDDENLPTLWSKMFKYQLELGHNDEAYNAMVSNPDPSRRKDCLRQLLVTLCERGELQTLVGFPYIDLQDEVVSILETRARSVDITTQNYYDLLYAFYVNRNNFGKAGAVMYEHGMRLGREVPNKQGLQCQAQCYLATMNALRLVDPKYAWIVKPVTAQDKNSKHISGLSSKHYLDGDEKPDDKSTRQLEVLELKDIEKEFMLVDARLRLLKQESSTSLASGPTPGADEMVGLLVNAGMYDRAIIICQMFDIKLTSVIDNLALRCVNLAKSSSHSSLTDNTALTLAWAWLQQNNLTIPSIKESSASDTAWSLLQYYLELYEDSTAQLHRTVVIRLLSQGFPLPSWLINSYKELNWAELLRLYTDFDQLEDGVLLTMEFVDSLMATYQGHECTKFRLKGSVKHVTQQGWLPYTCIDQLLKALKDHKTDITYETLFDKLQFKLSTYSQKMKGITDRIVGR